MLTLLKSIFVGPKAAELNILLWRMKEEPLPDLVIFEGDATRHHKGEHKGRAVTWDQNRLGPSVTDFDKSSSEFPKCTYKTLYRCPCGSELVRSVRALI